MRQYEIRKKLDELYKIGLVNKVRTGRGNACKEELYSLLSPQDFKKKRQRSVKSATAALSSSNKKELTKFPSINFEKRTRALRYEVFFFKMIYLKSVKTKTIEK